MHELSIAMNILDIAAEEAESRGGVSIKAIFVRMGPLSGVVKQALSSAFELAREDSLMADAELVIEETPLVIHCAICQSEQNLEDLRELACPKCGMPCENIVSGKELEIVAMEIEE